MLKTVYVKTASLLTSIQEETEIFSFCLPMFGMDLRLSAASGQNGMSLALLFSLFAVYPIVGSTLAGVTIPIVSRRSHVTPIKLTPLLQEAPYPIAAG